MTFVVPFDGTSLAETALVRAVEFSTVLDEQVLAVTAIPRGNAEYARERGWIDEGEPFDRQQIVTTLHEQVVNLAPEADFRHTTVGKYAPPGTIATRIRELSTAVSPSMFFIGSENAGRVVSAVSSVGAKVASEKNYDVVIVRNHAPTRVEKLRQSSPHRSSKSDFYQD